MTLFTSFIGFTTGVCLQLYSNGVRKLPYLRQPWLLPTFGVTGAFIGHKYPKWEKELRDDVNLIRERRGLKPLRDGKSMPDVDFSSLTK
ncbi:hypothetical protein TrVE_jg11374 [Triparma verrucosa]|uniref:Uncharacterized protein n=2 Tax=Triparma TaxID=722752 RepID=A0A9W7AFF2_9STRA|nr:hypothetical protein TrST_g3776 [Triparma strigata]GMH83605.1 hypothetical protein TrVE_jg11374 [Triparma verrucosa]